MVTAEQLRERVTPRQATSFFVGKFTQLSLFLERHLAQSVTQLQSFNIAQDQAHFKTIFFSGDQPGDLGQAKIAEILRFPNDDGFLFNHIWGTTLRDGDQNAFGIRRNPQSIICPIRGTEHCVDVARRMQVDLTRGYLFHPTTPNGGTLDASFTSTTAEARLKSYLKEKGQDDGETLYAFRSGCAVALALSGVELTEIMDHIGWNCRQTALHCLQLAKVLNPSGASARLASGEVMSVNNTWTDLNKLKHFLCAFPAVNSPERPLSD